MLHQNGRKPGFWVPLAPKLDSTSGLSKVNHQVFQSSAQDFGLQLLSKDNLVHFNNSTKDVSLRLADESNVSSLLTPPAIVNRSDLDTAMGPNDGIPRPRIDHGRERPTYSEMGIYTKVTGQK